MCIYISLCCYHHQGSHVTAAAFVAGRVAAIIAKNPWLGGRLISVKGKTVLTLEGLTAGVFRHVTDGSLRVCSDFTPNFNAIVCASLLVKLGTTEPGWKVAIVPCAKDPSAKFAMIVSMSHVIGDGYTFYAVHNMLNSSAGVWAMEPRRIAESPAAQERAMGKAGLGLVTPPACIIKVLGGMLWSKTLAPYVGHGPTSKILEIDLEAMSATKGRVAKEEGVEFVSTNDVLTSFLLKACKCTWGFMAVNFRNR